MAKDNERFRAENPDEIVFLRLNRLKSTRLCENLLWDKLNDTPNPSMTDEVIEKKAIGLASVIESALGYWQSPSQSLNSKILSRYYFMLQLTIAEQVACVRNTDGLREIQKHTENGHGLKTFWIPDGKLPDDLLIYATQAGHFNSYGKFLGWDMKKCSQDKGIRKPADITPEVRAKMLSLSELFRTIPELRTVIEEYLNEPPLSIHVGHSQSNMITDSKFNEEFIKTNHRLPSLEDSRKGVKTTDVGIYSESPNIDIPYLETLGMPLTNFRTYREMGSNSDTIIGSISHPGETIWWDLFPTYSSRYVPVSYVKPIWGEGYHSVAVNYMLLYALSIVVRYMPDIWYSITNGEDNHIGSLIDYYISVMDHVLPLQMLEHIQGTKLSIHSQGSWMGEI